MRKLYKLLCVLISGMVILFSVGCTFFDAGETRTIENIYSRRSADDTGIEIVIEYADGSPESAFFIPDPAAGEEGNGIRDVGAVSNADGSVTVTVEYTDVSMPPYVFTIPSGRYITDISSETDPETNVVTVTIRYSDGSEPVVMTLRPGQDGIDGDKISRVAWEEDEEGNIVLHIFYKRYDAELSDWVEYELEDSAVTIPKGRGIEEIRCEEDSSEDSFTLRIYYDDGGSQDVEIGRANRWYVGRGQPGDSSYRIGDFYFDEVSCRIYHKVEELEWDLIADFSSFSTKTHTVTFHLETEEESTLPMQIEHGYNFAAKGMSLPTEQKSGYRFLGWYTKAAVPGEDPDPNSGHFTDLTPVLSDLDLYPRWEQIAVGE